MSTLASPVASADSATRHQTYGTFTSGFFTSGSEFSLAVMIAGLTSGKLSGLPVIASQQNSSPAPNNWTAEAIPLTFAQPAPLADLVLSCGTDTVYAIGVDQSGKLYQAGLLPPNGSWQNGSGPMSGPTTFAPGTLSAQLTNTDTVFGLGPNNMPWVATYLDRNGLWQPGYALPCPVGIGFASIEARPELSNAGTTHVIGLTGPGWAAEVACASGSQLGPAGWTIGKGPLGGAGLPMMAQVRVATADAAGRMHVIGLDINGGLWDIDQFSPAAGGGGTWSGQSLQVLPAGSVSSRTFDVFVGTDGSSTVLNVITGDADGFSTIATYGSAWSTTTSSIPTSGKSTTWKLVNNPKGGAFILGLSGIGLLYQLAWNSGGGWTAGTQTPISG